VPERWKNAAALVALAAALLPGCAELARFSPTSVFRMATQSASKFTEEDLREALAEFSSHFASVIAGAAELASEQTRDRSIRRRALLMQMNAIPLVQEIAFQPDVQQAYLSTLTLVVMLRQFLTEGAGKNTFGAQQSIVADAVQELESALLELAAEFLEPKQIARMTAQVEAFARARPMQPGFGVRGIQSAIAQVPTQAALGWLIEIPMSPFRALEGVSSGAAAIREFNQTALELTHRVQVLPEQIRWQLELLLYDVEDRETVIQSLALMQGLEESADRASRAVESLPAEFGASLEASRGALADANQTIAEARGLVAALDPTVERIRATSEIWAGLVKPDEQAAPAGGEPGRPFDIREWESAAREISQAAGSLQELAVELRTLSEAQPSSAAVAEFRAAVDGADLRARAIVDLAFWRLAALALLCFALLAAYRLTLGRGPRGSGPA